MGEREAELVERFTQLADTNDQRDIVDTMDLLVSSSTEFTAAVEAGVMIADSAGRLHVVASTSERTSDVEDAQLGFDQGPCLKCFATGSLVEVPDISKARDQWPVFVELAEARGFRAAAAFPLEVRGQVIGGLNLFFSREGPISAAERDLVESMVRVATSSLLQGRPGDDQLVVQEQLQHALESRILIEQAKGVLSHRRDVPIDRAFILLRRHAHETGRRLRDVADDIVARRLEL